ncbi:MAG: phage baseplate assembly protein V [Pseudomonadota bacterium]
MLSNDLSRHANKFYGKYPGLVSEAPEPDVHGSILVKIPSIFGETAEVRARPCLPYGHFFIPPPEARIWVEFEAGNLDYPLWVGVWYPDGSAPEEVQEEPQTHRVIQTPKGHTIELSDEDDAEKIVVRHKDNSFIALQPDGSVLVSNANGAYVFLNAENGQSTMSSEQGHMVSMSDAGAMIVNDKGSVIELKDKTATILADNIVASGTSVALGANAAEPTIMGTAFKSLWDLVVSHTHPTAMGPSGPPVPPILPLLPGVHLTSSVVVK